MIYCFCYKILIPPKRPLANMGSILYSSITSCPFVVKYMPCGNVWPKEVIAVKAIMLTVLRVWLSMVREIKIKNTIGFPA
jgi:hypothetical protein